MELSAFLWKCARFVQYTSLPPVSAGSGLIRADRANLAFIDIEPAGEEEGGGGGGAGGSVCVCVCEGGGGGCGVTESKELYLV